MTFCDVTDVVHRLMSRGRPGSGRAAVGSGLSPAASETTPSPTAGGPADAHDLAGDCARSKKGGTYPAP